MFVCGCFGVCMRVCVFVCVIMRMFACSCIRVIMCVCVCAYDSVCLSLCVNMCSLRLQGNPLILACVAVSCGISSASLCTNAAAPACFAFIGWQWNACHCVLAPAF